MRQLSQLLPQLPPKYADLVHVINIDCFAWVESGIVLPLFCFFVLATGQFSRYIIESVTLLYKPRHEKTILCYMRTTNTHIGAFLFAAMIV